MNQLNEALRTLADARDELNYTSPCQTNPKGWDGLEEGQTYEDERERILTAMSTCIWHCKVFNQCTSVRLAGHATLDGVVAGFWMNWSDDGTQP